MGTHRRPRGRRALVIDSLLVGLLVLGLAIVGFAMASRQTPPAVASVGGPTSSIPVPEFTPKTPGKVVPEAAPVFLDIEEIGVHSALHEVGLDSARAIETPSGARYDEAAWYRHSPIPGSLGPSIIIGHVDSASNGPSVFFRLSELSRGDRVSVTRSDGSTARFTVETIARFSKEEFPTERVYGDIDHAGLRLITCGGAFDEVSGHYEDNVVVFARLAIP